MQIMDGINTFVIGRIILGVGFSIIKYAVIIYVAYLFYKKLQKFEKNNEDMRRYLKNINDYLMDKREKEDEED